MIARQALTNTVCDKLLNAEVTRWEEAQAVAASLREFHWLEEEMRKFRFIEYEND